jgi:hypothetical protein
VADETVDPLVPDAHPESWRSRGVPSRTASEVSRRILNLDKIEVQAAAPEETGLALALWLSMPPALTLNA